MIIPDVNVLVHLHRHEQEHHEIAMAWWREFSSRGEPMTVPDILWVGFVRIVTDPRIFDAPSAPEEAWQFIESVRAQGVYIEYVSNPRLLALFGKQLRDARASGNLVTDAYIASAAIALGADLVTFDRDFRRFDDLSVVELG